MEQAQADYVLAMEQFGQKVHAIRDEQWSGPTPCSEWSVRDLVNHLVYESLWAPDLLAGMTVAAVGDRYDGDNLGTDPVGAWDGAAAAAVAAFSTENALTTTVDSSSGPLAGSDYLGQIFLDVVIHGWDLARGIGAADTIEARFADPALRRGRSEGVRHEDVGRVRRRGGTARGRRHPDEAARGAGPGAVARPAQALLGGGHRRP